MLKIWYKKGFTTAEIISQFLRQINSRSLLQTDTEQLGSTTKYLRKLLLQSGGSLEELKMRTILQGFTTLYQIYS